MPHLYELTAEYRAVQALADDGEVSEQAIVDTLDALEMEISKKAEGVLAIMTNVEAAIPAIDEQIKRLQAMKKAAENRSAWFKGYLLTNMQAMDISKIECPLFKITRVKGRQVVNVADESQVPDYYMVTKIISAPDKKKLLADLKAGAVIPGAEIVIGSESLRIS